jgi:putative transposase
MIPSYSMPQYHPVQEGVFHITTTTQCRTPWCTKNHIPQIIIDNLRMTRSIQNAKLYAFCILPDHVHILIYPGKKGMSKFMQSFKKNSSRDISSYFGHNEYRWQKGYHDERIQDIKQRSETWRYIHTNPYKHNLVEDFNNWIWSSLHFRNIIDEWETI